MPEQTREQMDQRYQKACDLAVKVCGWIGQHQARAEVAAGKHCYKLAYQEQQRVSRLQEWYVRLVEARGRYWGLARRTER